MQAWTLFLVSIERGTSRRVYRALNYSETYPSLKEETLGRRVWVIRLTYRRNGTGGTQHGGKARTNRNRLDGALQDPHDMVKARLPDS